MRGDWHRVNRHHRCPCCGRDSWCIYTETTVLCMRTVSDHPKTLKSGEVGYLHRMTTSTGTEPMHRYEREPEPVINTWALVRHWEMNTPHTWKHRLAERLGVSDWSLCSLDACYAKEHKAWAFPMKDGLDNYMGIRLRAESGKKWAVRGSHQGIFVSYDKPEGRPALICEGPTDTAAGLTLGYWAVGRPSCSGGADHLRVLLKRLGIRRAIIVSDNDDPGLNGAAMIGKHLGIPSCILVPPAKDLRAYLNAGGDKATLDSMIKGQIWHQSQSSST